MIFKERVGLAITVILAGMCVTRGVYALLRNSYWVSPKYSPAVLMDGAGVKAWAMAQFALAIAVFGGWLFSRPVHRKAGMLVAGLGLLAAISLFAASTYLDAR
jgi:predicted hotdog family 3-hydroxylacyl-ACP dehydratase